MILRFDLMPAMTPVLIDLRGDGCSPEDFMLCYPFYPPSSSRPRVALGALHRPDCWRQNCPRLNGTYWVYVKVKVLSEPLNHSGRMEAHGSLLVDLSLTPEALLKEMPPDQSIRPSFPQKPLLLSTRSVNPLLNVRRHSVYVLNSQCWCAQSGVSRDKGCH